MQEDNTARYASISSVRRKLLDSSNEATLSNYLALEMIKDAEIEAVIQLHGFSNVRRKTRKAQDADFIISSGDKGSHLLASSIYQCLQENFDNAYLFGKNIYELGATENFLNLALQDLGYAENFVHIEISLPQRKKLLQPSALKQFAQCLFIGKLNAKNS